MIGLRVSAPVFPDSSLSFPSLSATTTSTAMASSPLMLSSDLDSLSGLDMFSSAFESPPLQTSDLFSLSNLGSLGHTGAGDFNGRFLASGNGVGQTSLEHTAIYSGSSLVCALVPSEPSNYIPPKRSVPQPSSIAPTTSHGHFTDARTSQLYQEYLRIKRGNDRLVVENATLK